MKPIVSKFPNNSNTEYRYQKHGIPGNTAYISPLSQLTINNACNLLNCFFEVICGAIRTPIGVISDFRLEAQVLIWASPTNSTL